MQPVRIEYAVQNPATNVKEGKTFPLIKVIMEELEAVVVTKSGEIGLATQVVILDGTRMWTGQAVYTPEKSNPYSVSKGFKLAMERALAKTSYDKKTREHIWIGCLWITEKVEEVVLERKLKKLEKDLFSWMGY